MTYDPTALYRTSQVTTSSPVAQIVLLYEGAIRFAAQSVMCLEKQDLEGAHNASLRAQAIIGALRESLDLSAGDVAANLDAVYDYMNRSLVSANVAKDTVRVREVIDLLRELLTAWRSVASPHAADAPLAPRPAIPAVPGVYRAGMTGAA